MEKDIDSLKIWVEERFAKRKHKEETPKREEGTIEDSQGLSETKPFHSPKFSILDELKKMQR